MSVKTSSRHAYFPRNSHFKRIRIPVKRQTFQSFPRRETGAFNGFIYVPFPLTSRSFSRTTPPHPAVDKKLFAREILKLRLQDKICRANIPSNGQECSVCARPGLFSKCIAHTAPIETLCGDSCAFLVATWPRGSANSGSATTMQPRSGGQCRHSGDCVFLSPVSNLNVTGLPRKICLKGSTDRHDLNMDLFVNEKISFSKKGFFDTK